MRSLSFGALALLLWAVGCGSEERPVAARQPAARAPGPEFVGEPALGEIGPEGAVFWARSDAADVHLHVRVDGNRQFVSRRPTDDGLRSARVLLTHLGPGPHRYTAWWSPSAQNESVAEPARRGRFELAPAPADRVAVRFGWGGDVGGQDVCRRIEGGFPTLAEAAAIPRDFFIALGDMIYADNACSERSRFGDPQVPLEAARDAAGYLAHWSYALDDAGFRALRRRVYAVWDDHEVVNDIGPREAAASLLPIGRRAFLAANPLAVELDEANAPLYRAFRYGHHLELLLLDTRSHRDANSARDDGEIPKTMLGATQRAWLEGRIANSDATWIVIASSVPLSLPTGFPPENGRDGWADHEGGETGFERELVAILRHAQRSGRRDLMFVTTDVHFAAAFRYVPFEDDPAFVVHEVATGPLSAGVYPIPVFDETLRGERLLFHAPDDPRTLLTLADARPYFTWGEIAIDADGVLALSVRNVDRTIFERTLRPR